MDEFNAYIPAPGAPNTARVRKMSTHSTQSLPHVRTSGLHRASQDSPNFRDRFSTSAASTADGTEIHAPIPRRHLLQTSESRHWLHTPPLSPSSSRPVSAASQNEKTSHHSSRHLSFSSLMEQEKPNNFRVSAQTEEREAGMGKRWVRWMHKHGMREWLIPCALIASVWIKWCIGLGSYSGQGTPPMFGDYEAQRHWMELTIHLPIRQWYTYDLPYWGLDYPPLTAYVSWLCGIIGSRVNPSWFALKTSRGIETEGSKVFLRSSVLALDSLLYVPALVMFTHAWHGTRSKRTQHLALLTLLVQPALLLVDFGHFQYNSVMLGLTLLSINFFAVDRDILGAFCFVLSLGFKQMALYYAPAIGSYLLGKCLYLGPIQGGRLFVRLAFVTTLSFVLLFIPFLPPLAPLNTVLDPIHRIFPFNRGLFEDKVANFWCASNVAFKWKNWASRDALVKVSAIFTGVGFLPSVIGLLQGGLKMYQVKANEKTSPKNDNPAQTPILPLLPYALLTSSMSFFLFSFQVHEKTILLPLLPMTLILSGSSPDSAAFGWGVLVNNTAVFSMWPLLRRDGLAVQYISCLVLWNRLVGYNLFRLPKNSFVQLLSMAVYAAALVLHLLELVVAPPSRYPDLYSVLNVLVSTPVFALAWLWSIKCGVQVGWALGGLGTISRSDKASSLNGQGNIARGDKDQSLESEAAGGIGRQGGTRTMSLGFAQGRRRPPFRAASVGADAIRL